MEDDNALLERKYQAAKFRLRRNHPSALATGVHVNYDPFNMCNAGTETCNGSTHTKSKDNVLSLSDIHIHFS